jgi:hypothetical protein
MERYRAMKAQYQLLEASKKSLWEGHVARSRRSRVKCDIRNHSSMSGIEKVAEEELYKFAQRTD